jgi:hypothetical protein
MTGALGLSARAFRERPLAMAAGVDVGSVRARYEVPHGVCQIGRMERQGLLQQKLAQTRRPIT